MGLCQGKGKLSVVVSNSIKPSAHEQTAIAPHKPLSRTKLSIWKVNRDDLGLELNSPDTCIEVYNNRGNGEFKNAKASHSSIGEVTSVEGDQEHGTVILMNTKVLIEGSSSQQPQQSFEEKKANMFGDKIGRGYLEAMGIAVTCKKGLKPESPNQDDYSILIDGSSFMLGVFDGHGPCGHQVSSYIHTYLPKIISQHPKFTTNPYDVFSDSFEKCHKSLEMHCEHPTSNFDCVLSGTTATLALVRGDKIYVAHVGDSRAVMSRRKEDGTREAVELTKDHKPDLPGERERISEKEGDVKKIGEDHSYRVFVKGRDYPGLAMSRAIGDSIANGVGVIPTPDVSVFTRTSQDEFLLLCSDGIWEFIKSQEAVDLVAQVGKAHVSLAANHLAKRAWSEWIRNEGVVVDDITVMIAYFPPLMEESSTSLTADRSSAFFTSK